MDPVCRKIAACMAMLSMCVFQSVVTAASPVAREIANPLKLDWPWELVHLDVPADAVEPIGGVVVGSAEPRPVQVQTMPGGGRRVWFIATVPGERRDANNKKIPADLVATVAWTPGHVDSPLRVTREGDGVRIDNGVLTLRLRAPAVTQPTPLSQLPHPFNGIKLSADADFYGSSRWEGDALVESTSIEIVEQGPVFVDVRIRYVFAGTAPDDDSQLAGLTLTDPALKLPAKQLAYEQNVRVVVGDPWVQVAERYRLPSKAAYTIEWRDGLKADTAMWLPWFGYERFGGNTDLRFAKLEPQPMQRGAFVLLRPRWNQQPGGGMDFLITRGGETPYVDRKTKETKGSPTYDPTAPAVGLVANYPSRWLLPYAQTVSVSADKGDTARGKFPVQFGARSYAMLCGPRDRFDTTAKLNSLVRRRGDWTLDDQMHERTLVWDRDPAQAGPRILLTRDRLKQIRDDWTAGRDSPSTQTLRAYEARRDELKQLERDVLDFLTGKTTKPPKQPSVELYLQRRYQDDFLNPTSRATRDLPRQFALADLMADGAPWGGPEHAAAGYVFSDLDHWPGLLNGWTPGNPNFHTDKYIVAAYAAAAMADHPDAKKWMAYARREFEGDIADVLLAPDGVGYECPGYSGYSLQHQLELARVFLNAGKDNVVAGNPMFKKTGLWHRHLLTPVDIRLGHRHEAPIGDTHKWTSGANDCFGLLATFHKDADPAFASEMMGVWRMLREQYLKSDLLTELLYVDRTIEPTPPQQMDWGSHAFSGFGSVMRSRFGTDRETFISFKAGAARGHYHNDELSYHFYGAGAPLSLDYNCSYTPRGDHAALHNSMTFGIARPFTHSGDTEAVPAMEQLMSNASVLAFNSSAAADVVVGERRGSELVLTPVDPLQAKFQYGYPTRKTPRPITHRRYLMLVKHDAGKSKLNDYMVVRDETQSADRQFINVHLLARELNRDGNLIRATGQWDTDATIYLASPGVEDVKFDRWYYADEWMNGPGLYRKRGVAESEQQNQAWLKQVRDTDGTALIPPPGWKGEWKVGEYQKWVRIETTPAAPMTWVLYPRKQGDAEPSFETLPDGGVRVTLGNEAETIQLGTTAAGGQAVVTRGDSKLVVLESNTVPEMRRD